MADVYRPFANAVQKITIYETKETLYVLGSDEAENIFRILEIGRNDMKELVIHDAHRTYTVKEIKEYLEKVRQKEQRKLKNPKLNLNKIAFGYSLAGFVRFTEGYYLLLVTSRKKVAMIGSHVIYKIEDTSMIYIPSDRLSRSQNPDEPRYAKLFENVDFSNNFYFSYTYDLTHTLQYNQIGIKKVDTARSPSDPGFPEARQTPLDQFLWNSYLLEPVKGKIHEDWIVDLIHGFLSQLNMIVFGKHVYITLIARRSSKYAGTRFLKRGCNPKGYVANEVETEQIVHDASQTSLDSGAFTSFVQLRGSIPLYWSQDLTKAMSKPPISLDFTDPYGGISSSHFRSLLNRYGAPVIILNLVKRREKRRRESMLWDELVQSINYLNQFLVDEHKIRYVAFDMARSNKKKGSNVLAHLDDITERCIKRTGFYIKNCSGQEDRKQNGVIRTNCVDCLDRTNTAQFAVGKHALGHQLNALGVTPTTELLFDTDCMRMLEILYEDQGDTIALQYGGSNLVHRVQSYRKTDMISSHSNDILQTLSRYYSNSFSDAEKQQAFNIFLGVYRPYIEATALWDLPTDYYLHNKDVSNRRSYCEWVDPKVLSCLPHPYNELHKDYQLIYRDMPLVLTSFESIYRTSDLTSFDTHFAFTLPNSIKSFLPKGVNIDSDLYAVSPFEVRKTVRWTHLLNQSSNAFSAGAKDPMGNSVFHTGSTTDDPDSSSSEESDIEFQLTSNDEEEEEDDEEIPTTMVTFNDYLEDPYVVYGVDRHYTNKSNTKLYKRYEKFAEQLQPTKISEDPIVRPQIEITPRSIFLQDTDEEVVPPTVKNDAKAIYKQMVTVSRHGASKVLIANLKSYEDYLKLLYR